MGNREINRILYTMSVTQARHLSAAKEYLARKRAEGKSQKEVRRAHKRQLAKKLIRRKWADRRRLQRMDDDAPRSLPCATVA